MTVTGSIISAVCESLQNPTGRFRTLKRIFPLRDAAGRPRFTVTSCTVDFDILLDGNPHMLRIPFGPGAERFTTAAGNAVPLPSNRFPFIAPWHYHRRELVIFTGQGSTPSQTDVLTEAVPEGLPLRGFIRTHLDSGGLPSIRSLLTSLAETCSAMESSGIIHGHIRPGNVTVHHNGKICLGGYIHSHERNAPHDAEILLTLALLSYITACEPSLFPALWRPFTYEERDSLLKSLQIQAQFNRNDRLLETAEALLAPALPDPLHVGNLLRGIASAPFTRMGLLKGLLSESGDLPTVDCARDVTIRYDAGEDPSSAIDFQKCDYVGEASENRVRYRVGDRWGFADSAGRAAGPAEFLAAGDFYEGRAAVTTAEGCGLLCKDGSYVMKPIYEALEWYGPENVAAASKEGVWNLYDRMGRQLTTQGYEWIGEPSEGLLVVKRGEKLGYLSVSGEPVTQLRFDEAFSFRDGSALVEANGEIYRIDTKGVKIP